MAFQIFSAEDSLRTDLTFQIQLFEPQRFSEKVSESEDVKDAIALEEYISSGNLPNIKFFYSKIKDKKTFENKYHMTPLQYAIQKRISLFPNTVIDTVSVHVIQVLIESGADIWETGVHQVLPLKMAQVIPEFAYPLLYGNGRQIAKDIYTFLNDMSVKNRNQLDKEGNSPLTRAVKQGWLPAIEYLLENGADLLFKGPKGVSPFCAALQVNNPKITEMLMSKIPAQEKTQGLFFAISNQLDFGIVKYLLESGANYASKDATGVTALHRALVTYKNTFIEYLIEKKKLETDALQLAIKTDDFESVQTFITYCPHLLVDRNIINTSVFEYCMNASITRGIPLDLFLLTSLNCIELLQHCFQHSKMKNTIVKILNVANTSGETILMKAIEKDNLQIVKLLIEMGANPYKSDKKKHTPLDKAAIEGKLETCKYLLQIGAKSVGKTALIHAIENYHLGIVKVLIEHGVDVNFKNKAGKSPLIESLKTKNLDIVKILIENRADLNTPDQKGKSPLDISVELKFTEGTKLLIRNGVDPNSTAFTIRKVSLFNRDRWIFKIEGGTLLHKYLDELNFDMVYFLIENKANLNQLDKNKKCPLVKVVHLKHAHLLSVLLEKGADPFCEHFRNTSLLSLAASEEFISVVTYLMEHGANIGQSKAALENLAKSNENFEIYLKEFNLNVRGNFGNEVANDEADKK